MGNRDHMAVARQGVAEWNAWRAANLRVQPNLTRIDLSGRDLTGVDFRGVGLFKANLSNSCLHGAILRQSIMIEADISGADLTGAFVYGVSAWDLRVNNSIQKDLVITKPKAPVVTCDNIEVAQLIHLLLSNPKLRDIIDQITSKSVLILGRFTPDRKLVLDRIRNDLRERNLCPVVFDFEGPKTRATTETVKILALLARCVIVDVTDPASSPYELGTIVPLIRTPVFPIVFSRQRPFSMMKDLEDFPWFRKPRTYSSLGEISSRVLPSILAELAGSTSPSGTPRSSAIA